MAKMVAWFPAVRYLRFRKHLQAPHVLQVNMKPPALWIKLRRRRKGAPVHAILR
jgi:hypothetical protein